MVDSPLGCVRGLSSESGRDPGSTRRGDPFSATDSEGAFGECAWNAAGIRLGPLEAETGMLET